MSLKSLDNGFAEEFLKYIKSSSTNKALRAIPASLDTINKLIGGFRIGEVTVISGAPGAGKSMLAQQLTFSVAKDFSLDETEKKRAVHYVSLEMSANLLMSRAIAMTGQVAYDKLTNPHWLHDTDWEKLSEVIENLATYPIIINDNSGTPLAEVQADMYKLNTVYDTKFLVIDYLQLLPGTDDVKSLDFAVKEIHRIAVMLNLHVLLISSLSNQDRLRGSRGIEYSADNVIMLEKMGTDDDPVWGNIVKIQTKKVRNGTLSKQFLQWNPDRLQFVDIDPLRVRDLRNAEQQRNQYG